MLKSMTGYGRAEGQFEALHYTLEIRSLNSRFVDLHVFVPRDMVYIEEWLRESLQKRAVRGKISCVVSIKQGEAHTFNGYEINQHLLREYLSIAKRLKEDFHLEGQIGINQIFYRPELLSLVQQARDENAFRQQLENSLNEAYSALENMQKLEGVYTKKLLLSQKNIFVERLHQVAELQKNNAQIHFESLLQRLQILLGKTDLDPDQFRQEAVLLTDKLDISEEIGRLDSHSAQFENYLNLSDEPVGKRLSFLLQEMLREVNTMGSKSNHAAISRLVVEMKNDLEILREQVQNIQ
ncbi:MAG TPA: YicC family protein [Candidatus Marinimicrobia bacterium]|nr:YicC family protein [Candidatus Neomarinimicrobiota bacterium]